MMKLSRNPIRWVIALALIPVAPGLVLWLAGLGQQTAETTHATLMENPWILVIVGAFIPALVIGLIVRALVGGNACKCQQQDACRTTESS
jgi:multisubunit Na+/H+ antiporter MnhC subunit